MLFSEPWQVREGRPGWALRSLAHLVLYTFLYLKYIYNLSQQPLKTNAISKFIMEKKITSKNQKIIIFIIVTEMTRNSQPIKPAMGLYSEYIKSSHKSRRIERAN